jgi:hypothetical protein
MTRALKIRLADFLQRLVNRLRISASETCERHRRIDKLVNTVQTARTTEAREAAMERLGEAIFGK